MYHKIMVPLDGSRFSEAALPYATSLARRTGAELHVVTVQEPIPGYAFEGWEITAREHGEQYLEAVREDVAEKVIEPVSSAFLEGHVTEALVKEADEQGVDLVVMASHGRGALSRFWLGSVTDAFVRHTNRGVLVIRPESDPPEKPAGKVGFKKILVPLDGTELSEAALSHAVELGTLYGTSYALYRAVTYPMEITSPYLPHTVQMNQALVDDAKEAACKYLDARADELRKRGYEVEAAVSVIAQPGRGILCQAEDSGSDLIAMSTHGRTGFGRMLLGSAADKVLRGTHVPLLLYRPRP